MHLLDAQIISEEIIFGWGGHRMSKYSCEQPAVHSQTVQRLNQSLFFVDLELTLRRRGSFPNRLNLIRCGLLFYNKEGSTAILLSCYSANLSI